MTWFDQHLSQACACFSGCQGGHAPGVPRVRGILSTSADREPLLATAGKWRRTDMTLAGTRAWRGVCGSVQGPGRFRVCRRPLITPYRHGTPCLARPYQSRLENWQTSRACRAMSANLPLNALAYSHDCARSYGTLLLWRHPTIPIPSPRLDSGIV